VTIYGGKLTGYRATAQKALALLRPALPRVSARADTATLALTP
jgi:glycerol-3-phosphate dehydrogenase